MYFYIDESGHTGPNLFDPAQPMLYYGVLSSTINLDVVAEAKLAKLRQALQVPRLHAAELGNAKLVLIADELIGIQRKLGTRFDLYRVAKPDHAIICFFDQVFDQGVNPAMSWTGYWTPLRFVLLFKLAHLFDENSQRRPGTPVSTWTRLRRTCSYRKYALRCSNACHRFLTRRAPESSSPTLSNGLEPILKRLATTSLRLPIGFK